MPSPPQSLSEGEVDFAREEAQQRARLVRDWRRVQGTVAGWLARSPQENIELAAEQLPETGCLLFRGGYPGATAESLALWFGPYQGERRRTRKNTPGPRGFASGFTRVKQYTLADRRLWRKGFRHVVVANGQPAGYEHFELNASTPSNMAQAALPTLEDEGLRMRLTLTDALILRPWRGKGLARLMAHDVADWLTDELKLLDDYLADEVRLDAMPRLKVLLSVDAEQATPAGQAFMLEVAMRLRDYTHNEAFRVLAPQIGIDAQTALPGQALT